jgi:hypothetical protein
MLTISSVSIVTYWSSRRHPFELVHTVGFWVGIAIVLTSVFILGSSLPSFQQPKLKIVVGNDERFRTHLHPTDLHIELAEHTDKTRVDVRLTRVRVVEYGFKWAERVRVEVVAVSPPSLLHEPVEFLNWYSDDNLKQWEDIPPGGSAWAILHTNIVNLDALGKSAMQGVTQRDTKYTAILAAIWNGKILDAVEIQVDGVWNLVFAKPESGFGEVTEIRRPKLRQVDKLNRKRLAARL